MSATKKLSVKIPDLIQKMSLDKEFSISSLELPDSVNGNSVRTVLARLVKQGNITRVKPGYYKKTEIFEQFLFVYGSMKRGCPNHRRVQNSEYIGTYHTIGYYTMYADSSNQFPYVVEDEKRYSIRGELYKITKQENFDAIDQLEGVPDFYRKKQVSVINKNGHRISAWIYLRSPSNPMEFRRENPMAEWRKEPESREKIAYLKTIFSSNPKQFRSPDNTVKIVSSGSHEILHLGSMDKGVKVRFDSFDNLSFLKRKNV